MENKFPSRKTTRWQEGNYNTEGLFFLTLCTLNKRCILSKIVGTGVLDGPQGDNVIVGTGVLDGPQGHNYEEVRVELLPCGKIADKFIKQLNEFYENISVENYVIMPNHIHILLYIKEAENGPSRTPVPTIQKSNENGPSGTPVPTVQNSNENGPSRTPVPTVQNSIVSRFISTFKRFCNKEYGENIWQYRSYDHIIRNYKDYEQHLRYIKENPVRWKLDKLYSQDL